MGLEEQTLQNLRENYRRLELTENQAGFSPFDLFETWFTAALESKQPEPNAMTLATVSGEGVPAARIVLLKGFSSRGLAFYTNYNSRKGRELAKDSRAALVFFWPQLERQIRIVGITQKLTSEESTDYFNKRPRESQLGAIVSPQSEVIASRAELIKKYRALDEMSGDANLVRPDSWGGYRVIPLEFEFWQGRPSRMHDRLVYQRTSGTSQEWTRTRLAP